MIYRASSGPNWRPCLMLTCVVMIGCSQKQDPVASTTVTSDGPATIPAASTAHWNPPSSDGYVGSNKCAECHEQIAESYRSHPMANSIRAVDGPPSDKTDSNNPVLGETRFYASQQNNGQMFHHEKMVDLDGKLIFDQAVPMHYEVGSGQRAFAYLNQQNDLLFQSPINWYSQTEQWDLSPGYQKDDPRRFRRRITDECLACHAGRTNPIGRSLNRFGNPAFHEMAIGCENCHGPGSPHVALHEAGPLTNGVTDPIINPINLHHSAKESVCNQCHLQATARVLRPGRSHFDFRPGFELEDIWTVLDQGVEVSDDGQTRAVNHVQQMRASKCYIGSESAMGCISCHNPHGLPTPETQIAFYRKRCYTCHEKNDCVEAVEIRNQRDNSCVACHMPHRTSNNISHVTQTDHRILRRPEKQSPEQLKNSEELTFEYFDDADQRLESWEAQRAAATTLWMHLDKKGKPAPTSLANLLTPTLKAVPNDHLALTLLGALANQHQRYEMAARYFESASKLPAGEESAVSGLLTINYLNSRWTDALKHANRMIEINPEEARFHALQADILVNLNQLQEGIAAARRSLQLDPTVMPVREWLVDHLQKAGRTAEYASELALLKRMKQVINSKTPAAMLPKSSGDQAQQ